MASYKNSLLSALFSGFGFPVSKGSKYTSYYVKGASISMDGKALHLHPLIPLGKSYDIPVSKIKSAKKESLITNCLIRLNTTVECAEEILVSCSSTKECDRLYDAIKDSK